MLLHQVNESQGLCTDDGAALQRDALCANSKTGAEVIGEVCLKIENMGFG